MSGYTDRNRTAVKGGPNGVQRLYASQLKESEPLFAQYEHLSGLQRTDAALTMLRKVASLVKPIMRKRNWKVQVLAEFLPQEPNLLGLNVNKGYKICIRLRFHNNPDLFLPIEQVVDTMLHELSHNVWGEHDSNFHRLWDELRDEHETLVRKGYTGEGFLSEGHMLGGVSRGGVPPPHEMRRLARASAEKRSRQGLLAQGSGQRLGGTPIHQYGGDIRQVIADQATRRNMVDRGCASGRGDAIKLSDQAASRTFRTKAEEDDANDRAIAQALFELMELEEDRKFHDESFSEPSRDGGLAWSRKTGLYDPGTSPNLPANEHSHSRLSEEDQVKLALRNSTRGSVSSLSDAGGAEQLSPVSSARKSDGHPSQSTTSLPSSLKSEFLARPKSPSHKIKPSYGSGQDTEEQAAAKRARLDNAPEALMPDPRNSHPQPPRSAVQPVIDLTEPHNPDQWTCEICTCINPLRFLACDACGMERPQTGPTPAAIERSRSTTQVPRWTVPKAAQLNTVGWNCERCGSFMEHKWFTCSACGLMKSTS